MLKPRHFLRLFRIYIKPCILVVCSLVLLVLILRFLTASTFYCIHLISRGIEPVFHKHHLLLFFCPFLNAVIVVVVVVVVVVVCGCG